MIHSSFKGARHFSYKLFIKCRKLPWYLLSLRSCLDRQKARYFLVFLTCILLCCRQVMLPDEQEKISETEQSSQRNWMFHLRSSTYFLLMTISSMLVCKDILNNVSPLIPNYIVRLLLLAEKKITTFKKFHCRQKSKLFITITIINSSTFMLLLKAVV